MPWIRRSPQAAVMPIAVALTTALIPSSATAGTIVYVDDDAGAKGDGSTWTTAYRFLQDALANVGAAAEIRVAQGIYKPDQDEGGNVVAGDRSAAFSLVNAVALRGGYAGIGAPNPDERDLALHETILSGDLIGNDAPNFVNNGENSYHVVLGNGTDSSATFDGFTVTGGNADATNPDDRGGGMLNNGSSPTVTNCTFSANTGGVGGTAGGGGMANVQFSSPIVTNCTFSGNGISNSPGGGMYNKDSSNPTVSGCTFSNNLASSAGAIYNRDNSSPTVTDCTFIRRNWPIAGCMICGTATAPPPAGSASTLS